MPLNCKSEESKICKTVLLQSAVCVCVCVSVNLYENSFIMLIFIVFDIKVYVDFIILMDKTFKCEF